MTTSTPTRSRIRLDDVRNLATIDPATLASLWDIDYDTVIKGLRNGEIPGFRVGRRWRIPVPRLLAMLGDAGPASGAA